MQLKLRTPRGEEFIDVPDIVDTDIELTPPTDFEKLEARIFYLEMMTDNLQEDIQDV